MLMKIVLSLAFTLAATNCLAVDDRTARLNAENATKLAGQGKYEAAFTEIGWLLRDASPSIRKYAEDVLRANPAVANIRLHALTVAQLTEMACEDGMARTKESAEDIVATVGRYAETKAVLDAHARIVEAFGNTDVADRAEKCQQAREAIKADEQRAEELRQAEEQKMQALAAAVATKAAPALLRGLDSYAFCAHYGSVLRGDVPYAYANIKNVAQFFVAEAKRRGVAVNKDLVLKERIRLGINQCTLYASWGYPNDVNRTVGAWGTHSQLVYGQYGPYVYLENGVVRSFQD